MTFSNSSLLPKHVKNFKKENFNKYDRIKSASNQNESKKSMIFSNSSNTMNSSYKKFKIKPGYIIYLKGYPSIT